MEKLSYGGFASPACGYSQHQLFQCFLVSVDLNVVKLQKDQRRHRPGPLITVNERVVLNEVEEIGSSHLVKVGVRVVTAKSDRRHGHRGLKKPQVSNTPVPAVPLDLVAVDFQDFAEAEESRADGLLRQALECSPVLTVHRLKRLFEPFTVSSVADR